MNSSEKRTTLMRWLGQGWWDSRLLNTTGIRFPYTFSGFWIWDCGLGHELGLSVTWIFPFLFIKVHTHLANNSFRFISWIISRRPRRNPSSRLMKWNENGRRFGARWRARAEEVLVKIREGSWSISSVYVTSVSDLKRKSQETITRLKWDTSEGPASSGAEAGAFRISSPLFNCFNHSL